MFLLKKQRKKTKKDRLQEGVQNAPAEPPAKAITGSNCSTSSGDGREREGREVKPSDMEVMGTPNQNVKNEEILDADGELNPSGDEWECKSEDYTEGQLGDPDDPATFLLDAVPATTLGFIEDTVERVNEEEIMTNLEEETCYSSTFEEESDRDYEELLVIN